MSGYPYPPDEFDARLQAPVAAHRARRSRWSRIWPYLLVAAIFSTVAIAGVLFLTSQTEDDYLTAPEDGVTIIETAGEPTVTDTDTVATGNLNAPGAGGLETDDLNPAAALLANADLTAYVRVINDRGPAGEAARGQATLEAEGFTNVSAETFPGVSGVETNTVWYAEGNRDTAEAVAAVLGIDETEITQQVLRSGDVLVVIRGPFELATE